MKKRKVFKLTLAVLSLFLFTNIVKADADNGIVNPFHYADPHNDESYDDNRNLLLVCEYKDTTTHELRVELYVDSSQQHMNTNGFIDGDLKANPFTISADEKGKNVMTGGDATNYMQYTGRCPKYAGYFTTGQNGYGFSNDDRDLKKADYVVRLKLEQPNQNYCHYSFKNVANPDLDYGWGFWYKKNIGKALTNGYIPSGECPAYVVTELDVTPWITDAGVNNTRRLYGADDGIALTVAQQVCAKEAGEYIEAKGGTDDEIKEAKCYTAEPTSYEDAPEGGSGEEIPTELDCDGLFDAETKNVISGAYFIIEVLAILIVIGLTIKDYSVAILNSNQDEIKKANKRLLTRLIVLVILLLLPALINLVLKLFKIEMFNSDPLCGTIKK